MDSPKGTGRNADFEQDFLADFSEAQLIQEIQRVSNLEPSGPLTQLRFREHARVSPCTIRRRLGGWQSALRKSGLEHRYSKRNRSDAQKHYVDLLREAATALNTVSPTMSQFDVWSEGTTSETILGFFGAWSKALQDADLVPRACTRPKQAYTSEECLLNLANLWKAIGRQPKYDELTREPSRIGPKAYERIWGTYSKALKAFVDWWYHARPNGQAIPVLLPRTKTVTMKEDELLDELMRVAALVGRSHITQGDLRRLSTIDPRTFVGRFGSWSKALGRAGIGLSRFGRRYKDEDYFINLMTLWEQIGRRPKYGELTPSSSSISPEAYCKRFGSWRKALLAFLEWAKSSEGSFHGDPKGRIELMPRIVGTHKPDLGQRNVPSSSRDRKRGASNRERFLVFLRDGFKCVYCGNSVSDGAKLHCDHREPRAKGGKSQIDNYQTLCDQCNLGKGDLAVD